MVTRNNSSEMMGAQVVRQMFAGPRALGVAAGILFVMGIVPGMLHVAFTGLALLAGAGAYYISHYNPAEAASQLDQPEFKSNDSEEGAAAASDELDWKDLMPVDSIGLEVGHRLISLVNRAQGGELLGRIKGIRKKLSQDLGFLIPSVHIRDDLDLTPNEYKLSLSGGNVGSAEVYPERDMAINSGQVDRKAQGLETKYPAFGLDALWIEKSQKDQAESLGYTVIDASKVIATHLNSILQFHCH